jgi:uncharacterized protein
MSNSLKQYALVTGASSGIGRAIAHELASRKVDLILVALPQTGLRDVSNHIAQEYDVDVKYCELDLTQEGSASHLYKWCSHLNVKINTLINNAGLGTQGSFENTTAADLETMLKLNNQALVMLTYYFLPDLKVNQPSNILNVGSLASFVSIPGKAVYSASKSFIYSFSLSLRIELKRHKISVSCLCPGGTITSDRVLKNIDKMRFAGRAMLQQPGEVAQEAVKQMYQGKKLIIPGWHNKFLYQLWALMPQRILDLILIIIFFKKEAVAKIKNRTTAIALHAIAVR